MMRAIFLSLAVLLCSLSSVQAQLSQATPEIATPAGAPAATATSYMVAAAHPLAVRAGRNILAQGGSAIDAAIATQMVLNLVEPQSSGIGGGAFLLYWDAQQKKLFTYDGRETAPAAASETRFLDADGKPRKWSSVVGTGLSVGVPGALAMLEQAHKAHGTLAWQGLFYDAIKLSREGFGVSPRLSASLADMGADKFSPAARGYFFDEDGQAWPLGHVLKNEPLAQVFEKIAAQGSAVFYKGEIAEHILAALADAPAPASEMTAQDLASYAAKQRPPVCAPFQGFSVCGMGPPSSGGLTVAQILMLLDRMPHREKPDATALHLIAEAEKLAYADRDRYMADSDFIIVPDGLLDPDYVAARAKLVDQDKASTGKAEAGDPPSRGGKAGADATREAPGTSHISIVDARGNAVSMTTSVESAFGARILVDGFLLNNQLTDFSFRATDDQGVAIANRPQGGKRPRSSMAPTMVFGPDGRLQAVLGSPGGSRIILYVVKAILAMTDWGLDPQAAAALPAFGNRNGATELEEGSALDALAETLAAMGHEIKRAEMTSGLHIIAVTPQGLAGGADPRREGAALGN